MPIASPARIVRVPGKLLRKALVIGLLLAVFGVSGLLVRAGESPSPQPTLETHHPQGWKFTMPKGDARKGRAIFEKLECYYCHEVRGEEFPFAAVDYGPELSQMGPLHPLEYFTESIINPDAVVGKQYRGADGKSAMPSSNDQMTVQELIDLSTYLASLKPKGAPRSVTGEGKVVALVPESDQIVIEHGAIKDFMDSMTMGYKVSSRSLLKTVKPGDRIRFTIDTEKRLVTNVVKLKN